jgi:hypothetical protein
MSNNDQGPTCGQVARAENLAAELTHAVYPLLLRRGLKGSWLKTELIVWKRLTRTIKRWIAERPRVTTARELDVLRERLLGGDSEELAALLCDGG